MYWETSNDVNVQRLSLTPTGKVSYELKTPFSNGTTHVIFEPLDFSENSNDQPSPLNAMPP